MRDCESRSLWTPSFGEVLLARGIEASNSTHSRCAVPLCDHGLSRWGRSLVLWDRAARPRTCPAVEGRQQDGIQLRVGGGSSRVGSYLSFAQNNVNLPYPDK